MPATPNPRSIITPDAFTVAPQLLGLPLATPSRRALAMLVDLLLVAILIKAGGVLLGVVAALVLWRFSDRTSSGGFVKTGLRYTFRAAAAIVAFIVVGRAWGALQHARGSSEANEEQVTAGTDLNFNLSGLDLSAGDAVKLMTLASGLGDERDEADAREQADSMAALLRKAGASEQKLLELRAAALLIAQADQNPAAHTAIDSAFGVPAQEELAREQQEKIALLTRENQRLRDEREQQRGARGVKAALSSAMDDLGLGFGWMAVYFTAFLGLMRGQTPGKKLMGIRVVRLDARPISWWIAFERFGGYAASATMGLLGFLQILWDRNRQGFHDKAVDTVVIRVT
jgi:uncharacterized RDD family membrane protein YckC